MAADFAVLFAGMNYAWITRLIASVDRDVLRRGGHAHDENVALPGLFDRDTLQRRLVVELTLELATERGARVASGVKMRDIERLADEDIEPGAIKAETSDTTLVFELGP